MELNIKKFNLKDSNPNSKILVIGKEGCGVVSLLKNITRHFLDNFDYENKFIISSNEDWKPFYPIMKCNILPTDNQVVNKNWNDQQIFINQVVDKIWNDQKTFIRKNGRHSRKLLLVLDDCQPFITKDINKSALYDMLMNSRHYDTTLIMKLSYASLLSPALRTNIDYVFMCRENNKCSLKKFYEHYGGIFPDMHAFTEIANSLTQNYMSMVIDNRTLETSIEHNVKWFKPKKYKQFNVSDWKNMLVVFDKDVLWRHLHKDIKKYMMKFFYEYSY